jgi:hypothetical protein
MFIHIVLWRLKAQADGRSKAENARLIKERIEEVANMLDGLQRLQVGLGGDRGSAGGDDHADVGLYMEFASRADFDTYYQHPAHQALVGFIREVRLDRRVIDYEV